MRPSRHIVVKLAVDVAICILVGLVLYFVVGTREIGFFCDDQSLMYPYKEETLNWPTAVGIWGTGTYSMFILVEVLNCLERRRCQRCCSSVTYCLKGYAIFLVGLVINYMFNDLIRKTTGRLRPHFFDICRPAFNRSICARGYILAEMYECTSTEHSADDILQARRSFPSGHAQYCTYIAVYLSLYVQRRLSVSYSYILTLVLQSLLVLGAVFTGITRIQDNWHHPSDVIAGSIFGTIIAFVVFWTVARKELPPSTRSDLPLNMDQTTSMVEDSSTRNNDRSKKPLIAQQLHSGLTSNLTSSES